MRELDDRVLTALSDLLDTGVFIVECRYEHRWLAGRVHLEVDGSLGEDSCGAGGELDWNEAGTVLHEESSAERGID